LHGPKITIDISEKKATVYQETGTIISREKLFLEIKSC